MMNLLLEARHIHVSYGARDLLHIAKLQLFDGDKIALFGANGVGKTTLLRALAGMIPVQGNIHTKGEIYYQPQLEKGQGEASSSLLRQLAIHEVGQFDTASGGEQVRLKLAQMLSVPSSILLCDEPTANLDVSGIAWLQEQLCAYKGALLLVSHDRALLSAVCTGVWELQDTKIRFFPGNYAAYTDQRTLEIQTMQTEYDAYQKEVDRITLAAKEKEQIASKKPTTPKRMGNSEARLHKRGKGYVVQAKIAKQSKALLKRIDHMEKKERPPIDPDLTAILQPTSTIVSKNAAYARDQSVCYGKKVVLHRVSFSIPSGKRTVIMGDNGSGKTTLLRMLASDQVALAPGAKIGLFDQAHEMLDPNLTLLENVMEGSVKPVWSARTILARLGLTTQDMDKTTAMLSGGERAKTLLAKLMVSNANFLIMDEPTNFLDLYAMEALESLLANYQGTLALVTHDRNLCDAVADRLLWIEEGKVIPFEGNYSEFEDQRNTPSKPVVDHTTHISLLHMRLAELSHRMEKASKDAKDALEVEYFRIAKELRELEK